MFSLNRRDFLKDSAWTSALLAHAAMLGRAAGSTEIEPQETANQDQNRQLRVAVCGVNGRGMSHVSAFSGKNNCVITTICDADEAVAGKAITAAERAQGKAPKFVQDIRKVVEDKEIDVITIASPNHWHALMTIWAVQNGKDVYCEKPACHNISEGRRMVEAARKYNRIVQIGTQSRSSSGLRQAMAYLHEGNLGKISLARGLCYKPRNSIGKVTAAKEAPRTVSLDLWTGPAQMKPIMRSKFHYDWHWQWDYGNGDIGNQGPHEMDKARWGLNKNTLPNSVLSLGGRFGYVDDGETANTQMAVYDFGDAKMIFEVRGLRTSGLKPVAGGISASVGNIFYGGDGMVMVVPSYTSATVYAKDGKVVKTFSGGENHMANFIKAVRSRKVSDLNCDVLEGHLSAALSHLANTSYRLGKEETFTTNAFGDDKEAADTFKGMQDHLKDNSVKLTDTKCRVGRMLKIDPQHETYVGDKDANAMLTREYRKGFVVPEKV